MTHLIPLSPWDSYRALGPIRDVYSHLLVAAARWQDRRERRTDPDHFALICVASDAGFVREGSPTRWTRTAMDKFWAVYHVLRCDVPKLVLVARLPLARRPRRGPREFHGVAVVRLPHRDRPAGRRERSAGGAAQAAAVLRRAGPAPAAGGGRRARGRRGGGPPAPPGGRPAAGPAGGAGGGPAG